MTASPSPTSSPAPVAVAMEAPVATVQLRAAGSAGEFRFLAAAYLGVMAYAWWPAAVAAVFLLPLFCAPTHPRRALWLWTAGLLAGGMALMAGRNLLAGLGGVTTALDKDPLHGSIGLAMAGVGVGLILWHLTWVKSPRRMG